MITHTSTGERIPDGCEIGLFTPNEDEYTHTIVHSLGETPKYAICLAIVNGPWSKIPGRTIPYEALASDIVDGVFDYTRSALHVKNVVDIKPADNSLMYGTNTYSTYPAEMSETTVTFATGRYYNGMFTAGTTYIYILIK